MEGEQAKSERVCGDGGGGLLFVCGITKVSPKTGLASGWTDTEKHFKLRETLAFLLFLFLSYVSSLHPSPNEVERNGVLWEEGKARADRQRQ